MIFRPKIFISSTFTENEDLRNQIHEYFYSVGAEPLLYEHELTPSILPMTYRTSLLDADFMIMIVKDNYGTETVSGLSGIHEEYKIAQNNNIPLHVYLKKDSKDSTSETIDNPLIDDMRIDGISYYYFDSDVDLIKRLKETTFTIAKEIMLRQIETYKLPKKSIIKLAGDSDYKRALEIITIIESMKNTARIYELDLISSSLFVQCLDCIRCEFSSLDHHFINWKIDDKLHEMLNIAYEYSNNFSIDFIPNGNFHEYPIKILDEVKICNSIYNNATGWTYDNYRNKMNEFFIAYDNFKALIQNVKTETDIV